MKLIYFLSFFLLVSSTSISQSIQPSKKESFDIDKNTQSEADKLKELLSLSEEQYANVHEIIHGILIKNDQVSSMKLIEEDKKALLKTNKAAKIHMIMKILIGKQKAIYETYTESLIEF